MSQNVLDIFRHHFFFKKLIPSHIQWILPIVMNGCKINVYVLYGSRKFHSGRTGISLSKKRKIMSRQIRKELELLSISEKNNHDDHLLSIYVYMKNRNFFYGNNFPRIVTSDILCSELIQHFLQFHSSIHLTLGVLNTMEGVFFWWQRERFFQK